MSPNRCEQFLQRTELLVRLLEGDLRNDLSERAKDEVRRVLAYIETDIDMTGWPVLQLAESDE